MKLTDLEPRWFSAGELRRVGLTFLCPHCKAERIGVAFHHSGRAAIEDDAILAVHAAADSKHIWTLESAEDFDGLTLSPSIDASSFGHWHGFITNGEIR